MKHLFVMLLFCCSGCESLFDNSPRLIVPAGYDDLAEIYMGRAEERVGHCNEWDCKVIWHPSTIRAKSGRYCWRLEDGRLCSGLYWPTQNVIELATHESAPMGYGEVCTHEMTHFLGWHWKGVLSHISIWADADPAWNTAYDRALKLGGVTVDVYEEEPADGAIIVPFPLPGDVITVPFTPPTNIFFNLKEAHVVEVSAGASNIIHLPTRPEHPVKGQAYRFGNDPNTHTYLGGNCWQSTLLHWVEESE